MNVVLGHGGNDVTDRTNADSLAGSENTVMLGCMLSTRILGGKKIRGRGGGEEEELEEINK